MGAQEHGYVYFLDAPEVNRIKIGTGVAPEDRLQAVRLMCPVPTALMGLIVGGRRREAELHEKYKHLRRHGEWFEGTAEFRIEIQVLCLTDAWEHAGPEARRRFREIINEPIMDQRYA